LLGVASIVTFLPFLSFLVVVCLAVSLLGLLLLLVWRRRTRPTLGDNSGPSKVDDQGTHLPNREEVQPIKRLRRAGLKVAGADRVEPPE
jgi:hypothetical protein